MAKGSEETLKRIDDHKNFVFKRIGDADSLRVERISSGSVGLDYALGGGWPRGRYAEIYGKPQSGKCVKGDSLIITDKGVLPIDECGESPAGTPLPCNIKVASKDGIVETSHFYNDGLHQTVQVETRFGFHLEGTFEHPIYVFNEDGKFSFKKLSELKIGDYACINRRINLWPSQDFSLSEFKPKVRSSYAVHTKEIAFPPKMTNELARFLGYMVAEGHIPTTGNWLGFTNSDEELLQDFEQCAKMLFNVGVRRKAESGCTTLIISSVLVREFLAYLGLKAGVSRDQVIPKAILQSSKEMVSEFLRAYFEGDGGVEPKGVIVTTASEQLSKQLQVVLLNFGIVCSRHVTRKCATNGSRIYRNYYRVSIHSVNKQIFADNIGFISKRKKDALAHVCSIDVVAVSDCVPFLDRSIVSAVTDSLVGHVGPGAPSRGTTTYGESKWDWMYRFRMRKRTLVSYENLEMVKDIIPESEEILKNHFFLDPIVSIKQSSSVVYDFVVPEHHNFVSNGFVSHNTLLTFFAIAEAQRMGGKAAFLDAEMTFDPDWARGNGVNVEDLHFYQPEEKDTGETLFDKLIAAVESNQFDVIAVDSVAALIPAVILNGEMSDVTIGAHARLMSHGVTVLTPKLGASKTVLLFINQTRTNPMQMFGNPETTTGGIALPFYASIRAEVKKAYKTERMNALKEPEGHDIEVTMKKNKTAAPFRKATVPVMYATGIIKDLDFINAAQARGIIAWDGGVKYKGERVEALKESRWKSFDVFTDWLKDPATDQAVVAALKQEIAEC